MAGRPGKGLCLDRGAQPFPRSRGVFRVGALHHNHELLTPVASKRIERLCVAAQYLGKRAQHAVAGGMAELCV